MFKFKLLAVTLCLVLQERLNRNLKLTEAIFDGFFCCLRCYQRIRYNQCNVIVIFKRLTFVAIGVIFSVANLNLLLIL